MKTKLLWAFIIISFLPMLILRDFTPDNEARYLAIADEALRTGHFFSFTWNGEPYADKPPFYLWLVMLCRQLLGYHSMLALSLLAFIPACGIIGIMNRWTRETLSEYHRSAATLMLITTAYFAGAAMVVRMDMLMCLFMVLAFRSFWRLYTARELVHTEQWLMGLWLFMALFTKGPLGLLIPLVSTIVYTVFKKRGKDLGSLWNWRTWLVLAAGSVVWFLMTYYDGGPAYLNNLVFHQTVDRGINSFHHARPFYYYLISIWYEWLPWALLCVGALVAAASRRVHLPAIHEFFLFIVVTTLVMLSCISAKLQIYLLPAFPFVIYLTAYIASQEYGARWVGWALGIPEALLTLAFPALLVAQRVLDLPLLHLPLVMVAAGVMSLFAAWALYNLVVKRVTFLSIQILAVGVLCTLMIVGLGMPLLNQYIV